MKPYLKLLASFAALNLLLLFTAISASAHAAPLTIASRTG